MSHTPDEPLQGITEQIKDRFQGVVVLGANGGGQVAVVSTVHKSLHDRVQAGKIIQTLAPLLGGKGGGRPDFARGSGKDAAKLAEVFVGIEGILAGVIK